VRRSGKVALLLFIFSFWSFPALSGRTVCFADEIHGSESSAGDTSLDDWGGVSEENGVAPERDGDGGPDSGNRKVAPGAAGGGPEPPLPSPIPSLATPSPLFGLLQGPLPEERGEALIKEEGESLPRLTAPVFSLGLGTPPPYEIPDREVREGRLPLLAEPSPAFGLFQSPSREGPDEPLIQGSGENLPRLIAPFHVPGVLPTALVEAGGDGWESARGAAGSFSPYRPLSAPPGEGLGVLGGGGEGKTPPTLVEPLFSFPLLATALTEVEPKEAGNGRHGDGGEETSDQTGWRDAVAFETSRGNYRAALDLLESRRDTIGDSAAYLKEKACILAQAGQTAAALRLTKTLLKEGETDAAVYFARAVAFQEANRSEEALGSLRKLQSINPAAEETAEARRLILTPLRSHVEGGVDYYHDSDSLEIVHNFLRGGYVVSPETRLSAGMEYRLLHVGAEPSLEALGGGKDAWHSRYWAGGGHRFSPGIDVELTLGKSDAKGQAGILSYSAALHCRANDALRWVLSRRYDYFLDSPRTVSLGIRRGANRVEAEWQPALDYVISGALAYGTFSDGNRSWEGQVGVQRKIFVQSLAVQIGPAALWTGFARQFDHGYYNPVRYQRYVLAASTDWSLTDDVDLTPALSLGVNKDEEMAGFGLSYDLSVDGAVALTQDWQLTWNAGVLRDSGQTGSYSALSLGVSILRRF
jgi:hypothetical protein